MCVCVFLFERENERVMCVLARLPSSPWIHIAISDLVMTEATVSFYPGNDDDPPFSPNEKSLSLFSQRRHV